MRAVARFIAAFLLCPVLPVQADWRGELSLEVRGFTQSPLDSAQPDSNLSISGELEYHTSWDDNHQSLTIKPFFRVDQHDDERTHADLREAVWIMHDDGWEVRLGVNKVFWGVTEVYHLVDIINQTDTVENIDGEQKLGQPMAKVSLEQGWGTLDFFVMPWFRERSYPSLEGRPRQQPRVAHELAQYENGRKEWHTDFALRWSKNLGDWDLGVAHFYGTGREPSLSPGIDSKGQPVLLPFYEIIHQTSLDLQGAVGEWLWKLEALHRSGQGASYAAATGGFEYTFYGINDGSSDLGLLVELMWDERGNAASTAFNHDVFVGLRWAANDVDGTELLTGVVQDWESDARFYNLEASQRIGNDWRMGLQARLWSNVARDDLFYGLSRDDYVEISLSRFF